MSGLYTKSVNPANDWDGDDLALLGVNKKQLTTHDGPLREQELRSTDPHPKRWRDAISLCTNPDR